MAAGALVPFQSHTSEISGKIIDGTEAVQTDWEFIAAIVDKGQSAELGQFCGGSILDSRRILTAAHCVYSNAAEDLEVIVGINDLTIESASSERIGVSNIMIHKGFKESNLVNDIAVLELNADIQFISSRPVLLPMSNRSRADTPDGTLLEVAGWGSRGENTPRTTKLMEVQLPLATQASCAAKYNSNINYRFSATENINSDQFCAGDGVSNKDSCNGDSGGPLIRSDTGEQLGIVSYGENPCGKLGVYSNVSYFLSWVKLHQSLSYNGYKSYTMSTGPVTRHSIPIRNTGTEPFAIDKVTTEYSLLPSSNCEGKVLISGQSCQLDIEFVRQIGIVGFFKATLEVSQNGNTEEVVVSRRQRPVQAATNVLDLAVTSMLYPFELTVYQNGNPWQPVNSSLESSSLAGGTELILDNLPKGYIGFDLDIELEAGDSFSIELNNKDYPYSKSVMRTSVKNARQAIALDKDFNTLVFSFNKARSDSGKVTMNNLRVIDQAEYESITKEQTETSEAPSLGEPVTDTTPTETPKAISGDSGGGGTLCFGSLLLIIVTRMRKLIR